MSKLRKKLDKEYEELVASGQEGKKGRKYAKEKFAKDEKKAKEDEVFKKEILRKKKKSGGYIHFLADLLLEGLRVVEWPPGWTYKVAPTKVGVVMEIQSPTKQLYRTAFRAVRSEKYDSNAISNFVERASMLVEREAQKSGIILP